MRVQSGEVRLGAARAQSFRTFDGARTSIGKDYAELVPRCAQRSRIDPSPPHATAQQLCKFPQKRIPAGMPAALVSAFNVVDTFEVVTTLGVISMC